MHCGPGHFASIFFHCHIKETIFPQQRQELRKVEWLCSEVKVEHNIRRDDQRGTQRSICSKIGSSSGLIACTWIRSCPWCWNKPTSLLRLIQSDLISLVQTKRNVISCIYWTWSSLTAVKLVWVRSEQHAGEASVSVSNSLAESLQLQQTATALRKAVTPRVHPFPPEIMSSDLMEMSGRTQLPVVLLPAVWSVSGRERSGTFQDQEADFLKLTDRSDSELRGVQANITDSRGALVLQR